MGALTVTAKLLIKHQPKKQTFHLLLKIHKLKNPGRPIVSACSCPTEHIHQHLDTVLQPTVQSLPTYLKASTHALNFTDSRSNQCSTTGVSKAMECAILTVGWCI